ncbi:PREDICTED: spermatogenesis-associated protein 20 isoform X1 [Polistes dominula]|uniref:Spermatogenesis-associated protein 20 isoform X1 n=2 Tax=Polistes dominula TaxID=743375 RepID=A0ABM1JC14_POLDO|nr:PREDICTED: spermatogenesis-associated protein 20 isoform X1 [Polistes dominula]
MLLGRSSLLLSIRYLSELSKKQYSRSGRKSRSSLQDFTSVIIGSQLCRSTYNSEISLKLFAKTMASSTKNDTKNIDETLLKKGQNRLALEKSPYLLQHARNPVQWYPWGDEALEKAKAEDKVIFLSVGYSTCHWCHVMEKESFENPRIAEIMNKNFVNIKVDREERPDIDRIYMAFIQAISGHGGWPMSVFLAPNLTPIIGGTYFPPEDRHGLPGFQTVLFSISKEWRENKSELMLLGGTIIQRLKNAVENKGGLIERSVPSEECGMACVYLLRNSYEPNFGGFSEAPKFPQPVYLNLLFYMYARDPSSDIARTCLDMCVNTLKKMALGGIHDHIGQGFARYSVDEEWHVPHFEKMLYDQGQLLQSYTEAFLTTKDPFFAEIIDDIATYVSRDLRHKEGGFYSAEDADSYPTETSREKKEGAFYVWSYDEINTLLAQEVVDKKGLKLSEVFCFHFTVKPKGNVPPRRDPHGELSKQNVLIVYGSVEDTAKHFGLTVEKTQTLLKEASRMLFEVREKRPRPHLDDKILAAWNGLMISGLARAGSATGNKRYVDLATDAAKFIERYLYDKSERLLLRSCYRSDNDAVVLTSVPIRGYHADYAFVVKGLLDLYEANLDPHWLEFAETLQDIQDELFWDTTNGGYYSTTKDDPTIILRLRDDHDGAEPCSNSIACGNLLRLTTYLERIEFKDKAERLLTSFQKPLTQLPSSLAEMVKTLLHYHDSSTEIYIIGNSDAEDTNELLRVVRERLIPGQVLIFADPNKPDDILIRKNKVLAKMKQDKSVPRAYVCKYRTCSLPVTTPAELADLLSTER